MSTVTSAFRCPQCSQPFEGESGWAGREVVCPFCQRRMLVPGVAVEAPAAMTTSSAAFGWRLGATRNSSAPSCFALTAASWALIVLVWGWVLTRPAGAFSDQGGMAITFLVLPLTLLCWLVGGPVALGVAHRARSQLARADGELADSRLTRTGLVLSRLMLWSGVAFVTIGFLREITR